jgi:DNA-3-methyladenine glycosylase II
MDSIFIPVPKEFNFDFSLQFLQRSPREILHRVDVDHVTKLLRVGDELVLFSVRGHKEGLALNFHGNPSAGAADVIVAYVREWFDLDADLAPFYRMGRKDDLLAPLVKKFRGLRIMSYPDLFESLTWAVLGQQINLSFAYTLKQRFVETYGDKVDRDGQAYYLLPRPERIAELAEADLLPLQFSRQKSKYVINIAKAFVSGEISKARLQGMPLADAGEVLMKIKGIGNWTANYALMRTYRYPDAFPLEDAGLHNALKKILGMKKKPDVKRVKAIFRKYKGFEAYATVYFWKTL